jgi:hypothetical protein
MDPNNVNVSTTVGSPIDLYRFEVIRDVINVKEAWESYQKNDSIGVQTDLSIILARTQSLFNCLYAYLKRKIDAIVFAKIQKDLFDLKTQDQKVLREIFWTIQFQLDKDQLTKLDLRKSYDGTRAEKENENFML